MRLAFDPGLSIDGPPVSPPDDLRWLRANNVRWRRSKTDDVVLETIGCAVAMAGSVPGAPFAYADDFSADFDRRGYPLDQVSVGYAPYTLFPYSAPSGDYALLCAGLNVIDLVTATDAATETAPTFETDPLFVAAEADELTLAAAPGPMRAPVHPFWWFVEQDDLIIGGRTGADEPPWAWDKDPAETFEPIVGAPRFARGAAIVNRILVLLGAESLTHPDPTARLTVRWSARFDFADWTPTDVNTSGELQLEGGAEIVGGGMTRFGVAVWLDTRLAILSETGDNLVFAREYVDDSAGLLNARAWCEANGSLWWLAPDRTFWRYDGGRATRVPCPIESVTLRARPLPAESAWFMLTANPARDEVWISYRAGSGGMNRTAIYNYALDRWTIATFFARADAPDRDWFTAFSSPRAGLPVVSAFHTAAGAHVLSIHDLSDRIADEHSLFPGDAPGVVAALHRPQSWFVETRPFVLTEEAQQETMRSTRVIVDGRANPMPGDLPDVFSCDPCAPRGAAQMLVTLRGIRRGDRAPEVVTEQTHVWTERLNRLYFRVAGRYLQMRFEHPGAMSGVPSVYGRLQIGSVWLDAAKEGER